MSLKFTCYAQYIYIMFFYTHLPPLHHTYEYDFLKFFFIIINYILMHIKFNLIILVVGSSLSMIMMKKILVNT